MISKLKQFGLWVKKWILLIIFGGAVIVWAAGMGNGETPYVMFNLQKIEFFYTDDNTNENIIIRTDREVYGGLFEMKRATVYAMIEIPKTQRINAYLFFSQDNRRITELYYLYENPNWATSTYDCSYWDATNSQQVQQDCVQIDNPDEWIELSLEDFDQTEYNQLVDSQNISVKDKKGFKAKKKGKHLVLKGTYYLKAVIEYPIGVHDEFFVEIIGSEGNYGHLDPTILSDPEDFNAYNDGDLNGQGNWGPQNGSHGDYDIQGTTTYEGAKAVYVKVTGSNAQIRGTGTGVADGSITFYFYPTGGKGYFYLRTDPDGGAYQVQWWGTGDDVEYRTNVGFTKFADAPADNWYPFQIEWRSSDNKARYNFNEEGWTGWFAGPAAATPAAIVLQVNTANSELYLDYISADLYSPPVAGAPERVEVNVIEEL